MTTAGDVLLEAGRLTGERRPYAFATVVRVERPASAREGNHAIITSDGSVVGCIGGACSGPTVIREALQALAEGKPRLVAIEGSCASEGLVEVFIEPQLPEPLVAIVGESPAAAALSDLATRIGWRVAREVDPAADAVVVATMGHDDEGALGAALSTPAPYVGLVASTRRGQATLAALRENGVDDATLARVRCPAGLDLGPSTQEEIAVAILAELVAWVHLRAGQALPLHGGQGAGASGRQGAGASGEQGAGARLASPDAADPVCGMTVAEDSTERAGYRGVMYYFCGAGCRRRFESNPAQYVTEVKST